MKDDPKNTPERINDTGKFIEALKRQWHMPDVVSADNQLSLAKTEYNCEWDRLQLVSYSEERTEERANRGEPVETEVLVSKDVIDALNEGLRDQGSDIRRLCNRTVQRSFAVFDISDFSENEPFEQRLMVPALNWAAEIAKVHWEKHGQSTNIEASGPEAKLCIGDGYIYAFVHPLDAFAFTCILAYVLDVSCAFGCLPKDIHFRAGLHSGDVYTFWDGGRENWNYLGSGINGAARVLAAVGKEIDDVVFVSHETRKLLQASADGFDPASQMKQAAVSAMKNRGRKKDKHDNPWRVYEVDASSFIQDGLQGANFTLLRKRLENAL
jgi:hypothetical protein